MNSEIIFVVLVMGFIGYYVVGWGIDQFSKYRKNSKFDDRFSRTGGRQEKANTTPENAPQTEWFEILEVESNASIDEIKAAYRVLIRKYHPDKVSSLGSEFQEIAERKSKEINAAYQAAQRAKDFN